MNRSSSFIFCIIYLLALNCYSPSSANPFFTFTDFYDFLDQYQNATEGDKPTIINDYMFWQTNANGGFPAIINATHVVFIYYNSSESITSCLVSLDIFDWVPFTMVQLDPTVSFFYRAFTLRPSTRANYQFFIDGVKNLDPRNQYRITGIWGWIDSELALPPFEREYYYVYRPDVPHGSVTPLTNFSSDPYVQIYLPPDYNVNLVYPVVYFADGSAYTEVMNTTTILDNLIFDDKIIPLIAVFSDPLGFDPERPFEYDWNDRSSFYKSRSTYLSFLDDLVAYIDDHYSTIDSPFARLHVGLSLTGYVSAYVAFERSDTIKLAAIQSGSSSLTSISYQLENYANASLDLKFWICVGTYESLMSFNEELYKVCKTKEWETEIHFYPEGHSYAFWQHTMDELLVFFFPNSWTFTTATTTKATIPSWNILLLILSLTIIISKKKSR
ncbi:hypothetical protein CEE45_02390 [Candidatus Heimdallarchaeota archaeon B3_Heim]|nr:MAG: hypothetical protein CEE45_02390 [Candidatus Heimdallarchaeota archaeon B3_Heim]